MYFYLTGKEVSYKTKKWRNKVKAASWTVLSTEPVHCDSGGASEAYFGAGTKLTVLGKISFLSSLNIALVSFH